MRYKDADFSLVSKQMIVLIIVLIAGALLTPFSFAQQGELSVDETAKKLANPAGSLANLANNLSYRKFKGDLPDAGSQDVLSYTFQPVLPFPVGDQGRNIIFRPAFTLSFGQPVFNPAQGTFEDIGTNLNDITFDLVYAGTEMKDQGNGYLWAYGLAGTIPVATNSALGGKQWRFGPEIFGGVIPKWGVFGALVNNQWNLGGGGGESGSNDQPFSTTTAQYFYGITLGNGWQILSAPVITVNWEADGNEAWSVPVGTGIAKTLKIGGTTWRCQVEAWKYVVQPDSFGSDWFISLDIRPVIQNPFVH
jgi:hypothetical protein